MGNPEKERDPGGQVHIECPSTPLPDMNFHLQLCNLPVPLTLEEKKYLLAVERGDMANVRRMLQKAFRKKHININCVDPFGRGALTLAIDGENLEMVELLVVMGVDTKDGLLIAINAEFVEAVELLLEHEELIHKEGDLYSWQKVDITTSMFTPDITPLMLAAHKNNYEILKILLDRGATLPTPHDVKCGCSDCIKQSSEDSLRHSLCRVNQYRALASPSLIALSSTDPLLTAFQLSWELRNLAFAEQESKSQYLELRRQCQQFAVDLLDQTRTSQELAIILNHDPDSAVPYMDGEHMGLARLEAAIDFKQKKFVAHPNIQQLLASLWYEGVPGFRRKTGLQKATICAKVALLFPMYCVMYMIAPGCDTSKIIRKPFMKFLIHASSYLFFLLILILVSQRAEVHFILLFGTDSMKQAIEEFLARHRGNGPTPLEILLVIYVIGFIWEETQEILYEGIQNYLKNMWNFIDFSRNSLYVSVVGLRLIAYIQQTKEINKDPNAMYIPREQWDDFDPQLIAEGLFAAANVFSALKLVHLFSINPHLGPLQISLGRMVIDIVKFFFIYSLVLFAFACGLNQLLWYFADLEKNKCYSLPGGLPDWDGNGEACMKWRRFGNLFESSQSLFWASFGMVGLEAFELSGIKSYTRFWGLLMFGSYSVINVIVLLNLLIAMMSNSYAVITEHSDTEWKFARTKLWLSYFEEGGTLPPPFNIFPTAKNLQNLFGRKKRKTITRASTIKRKVEKERMDRYTNVMRALVWRYVAAMHRKLEDSEVTEDDINEVKNDISTMRYEMLEVFEKSGMDVSCADRKGKAVLAKRMKVWERRLMKDFHVAPVEMEHNEEEGDHPQDEEPLARFKRIAKKVAADTTTSKWGEVMRGVGIEAGSQIGRCRNRDSFKNQQNLQRAMKEARRFVMHSPLPASRPLSPIEIVDPTTNTLLELLRNIQDDIGDISPGDTLSVHRPLTPAAQLNAQLQAILSKSPSPYATSRSRKTLSPPIPKTPNVQSPHGTLLKSTSVDQANLMPPLLPTISSPPPQHEMQRNFTSPPPSRTSPIQKEEMIVCPPKVSSPEEFPKSPLERDSSTDVPTIQVSTVLTLKKSPASEPDPVPLVASKSDAPKVVKARKGPAPCPSEISRPLSKPVCEGQGMIPPPPSKADETPILNIPKLSTTPATPIVERKVIKEPEKVAEKITEVLEPIKLEPESPKASVMGLGVVDIKASSSSEQLISEEVSSEVMTKPVSPTCLRPIKKIDEVTTVKRPNRGAWL